jgi:hypothetical protein
MYYFIARFKVLRQCDLKIKRVGIAVPSPKKAETRKSSYKKTLSSAII